LKYLIEKLVREALASLPDDLRKFDITQLPPLVERTRDATHGEFATNVALQLAKGAERKPRDLAQAIIAALPQNDFVTKVEIAGPGFINFFLSPGAYHQELLRALDQGATYGRSSLGGGKRVMVEFVSANERARCTWVTPARGIRRVAREPT
jgi:arginyl-tRNA synthetase